jgi:hypothetical protein
MLMAVSIGFLFFVGLLGINVTTIMASRNSAQRAADASALAGCLDLDGTVEAKTIAEQRAIDYAQLESHNNTVGFTEGGNFGTSVEFGNRLGLENNWIRVTVQRDQPVLGWAGFGVTERNVQARAACTREEGGSPVMHSLSTGEQSFSIEGSTQLNLGRGGVTVGAADCSGGRRATVLGQTTVEARFIEVCSPGSGTSGNSGIQICGSCTVDAQIVQDSRPDPYAHLDAPSPPPVSPTAKLVMAECTYPNVDPMDLFSPSPRNPHMCEIASGDPTIPTVGFQPGTNQCADPGTVVVYYGGMKLGDGTHGSGGPSREITICPGIILYMAGGGLVITPRTTVYGSGVMIFNGTNPHTIGHARNCGQFLMEHSSRLLISVPGPSPYDELIFYQQRDATMCDATAELKAGVTVGVESENGPWGSLYLPTAEIQIGPQSLGQGGGMSTYNVRIVAYEIDLTGPVTFNDVFIPSGTPKWGDVRLSE